MFLRRLRVPTPRVTDPTITWSPACAASSVGVDELVAGTLTPRWGIQAAALSAPIKYGVTPSQATTLVAPQNLQSGHSYSVVVITTTAGGAIRSRGDATLTP